MKKLNKICGLLASVMLLATAAACGGSDKKDDKPSGNQQSNGGNVSQSGNTSVKPNTQVITTDTKGELTVMVWAGDGQHHEDIGHQEWAPNEISGFNTAMIYAIAKEFNKTYPNIKINLHSKADDPEDWGLELDNYQASYGKYPDIFLSKNVYDDMQKGLIADLSRYKNDSAYQMLNESLLKMCNFYGFQGALPQYAIPWGVYVNKELAYNERIRTPEPDWTWEDYTDFVANKVDYQWYGSLDASMTMLKGAYIETQLQNFEGGDTYVNFTTDDFKDALPYLVDQAANSFKNATGDWTDQGIIDYATRLGNYEYYYFSKGGLLTLDQHPWMFVYGNTPGGQSEVLSESWDYYPRPALTDKAGNVIVDNHVGVVLDPISVYNYCADDGNNTCSESELKKMDIAYAFTSFWLTSTDAWTAASRQRYSDNIDEETGDYIYTYATPQSFPLIKKGAEYDKQMEIWLSTPGHIEFADAEAFPGFAEVVKLWGEEKIYGVSDKAFPRFYMNEGGEQVSILHEIDNFGVEDVVGVPINSPNWYSTYTAFLGEFNDTINGRYEQAFSTIRQSLITYYGYAENDERF